VLANPYDSHEIYRVRLSGILADNVPQLTLGRRQPAKSHQLFDRSKVGRLSGSDPACYQQEKKNGSCAVLGMAFHFDGFSCAFWASTSFRLAFFACFNAWYFWSAACASCARPNCW